MTFRNDRDVSALDLIRMHKSIHLSFNPFNLLSFKLFLHKNSKYHKITFIGVTYYSKIWGMNKPFFEFIILLLNELELQTIGILEPLLLCINTNSINVKRKPKLLNLNYKNVIYKSIKKNKAENF